jgi:hypothetical protein
MSENTVLVNELNEITVIDELEVKTAPSNLWEMAKLD